MLGHAAARLAYGALLAERGKHEPAFRQFVRAARAGLPAAQFRVGRSYLLGLGVPSCLAAALQWLTRAGEGGDIEAQSLLASLALQGITANNQAGLFEPRRHHAGRPADHRTALHWARRAAAGGSAEAQAVLGYILTAGPAELRDPDRGTAFYRQAAEGGSPQGKLGWALALLRDGTDRDDARVRDLLQEAAGAGLAAAHYTLGTIADGVEAHAAAAMHYRAGGELGHSTAQFRYGLALLAGRGVPRDPLQGESWLRRAALADEKMAAAMLGDLYARPGDPPPNYCEAAMWYLRAAEAGHVGAARALGQLYLRGDGFGADPPIAVRWLRLAAEAGDALAAYDLGLCCARGVGTARDTAAARRWLKAAAEALPDAQYWYGRMLAEDDAADLAEARGWFLRAAEAGNGDAAVAAGEMLINGRGGPADRAAAMALFAHAAQAGHAGAKQALELVGT